MSTQHFPGVHVQVYLTQQMCTCTCLLNVNTILFVYSAGTVHVQIYACLQNEIRSLVSLGDGAAGGGGGGSSSVAGLSVGPRGLGSGSSGGSGAGNGEPSNKRSGSGSGSGRTPAGASKKKKENSSGPLLFDNAVEWWRRNKVSKKTLIQKFCMS